LIQVLPNRKRKTRTNDFHCLALKFDLEWNWIMTKSLSSRAPYDGLLGGIAELLDAARHTSARAVNALMSAAYWEIGRRIVEFEQKGRERAAYGQELLERLSLDLTKRFGRGFSRHNLARFRDFYAAFPPEKIRATLSLKFNEPGATEIRATPLLISADSKILPTPSEISQAQFGNLRLDAIAACFPLPWSHYVLLVSRSRSPEAMEFYHTEALRGGWSVRTLDRQMSTLLYERTALSRDKAKMLAKHAKSRPGEPFSAVEAVRDPLVLEFLNLKDDYSESDLEEALIRHLQKFLLELGDDFAFVDRQRRLRIDSQWYRIDLLFFHRVLRCLVVIDLKLGKFTHSDAGQMHLYLNYAREHWTRPGENPPIGLILCSAAENDVARYALEGLPNQVVGADYRLRLPDEKTLLAELRQIRRAWEMRQTARGVKKCK
jgi:predicted nuclease of restriction endonuclease-like (RecB) superfamily